MLQVKFFQVPSGNYYVKVWHVDDVIDTTHLRNVYEHTAAYIKAVMTWGYNRSEIEFIIDSTCDADVSESIARDISIYADEG